MAAINLLEQKPVQRIIELLLQNSYTAPELNKIIAQEESLCSTATLYRRLKELHIASIIEKMDDKYNITEFGKSLYQEFKSKQQSILDSKFNKVLNILLKYGELSTTQILNLISISPNDLIEILKELEEKNMVSKKLHHSGSSRGGRPSKHYQVSKRGRKSSQEYKELSDRVKRK